MLPPQTPPGCTCCPNSTPPSPSKPHAGLRTSAASQHQLRTLLGLTLAGAVRTFEPGTLAQFDEGFLSDYVPALHHHWRVPVRGLLFGDGADEDAVVGAGGWEWDLDLEGLLEHGGKVRRVVWMRR